MLLALTGCASGDDAPAQAGFVAGDPQSILLAPADRDPAPDLTGELLGGGTYSLAAERGDDVLVVNVWGSWCAPCRGEAPALEEVFQEVKDRGVQFLGINTRDQDAQARAFVERFGMSFPSVVDDGSLQAQFNDSLPILGIPTTLVIDRQGRVAARTVAAVTYTKLLALVESVLAEDATRAPTATSAPPVLNRQRNRTAGRQRRTDRTESTGLVKGGARRVL